MNLGTDKKGFSIFQDTTPISIENVPIFLRPFNVTSPAAFLRKHFPEVVVERMAGFISGFGLEIGVELPEWVRNASKQFWKNYFPESFRPTESVKDFGVLSKFLEEYAKHGTKNKQTHPIEKLMVRVAKSLWSFLMQRVISTFNDQENSDYYAGRVFADEIIKRLDDPNYLQMVKLAKLYMVVSVAWRKIESFATHAERERWLRSEEVIGESVTSREVYQAFDRIGLPAARRGRPKKLET